MFKLLPFPLINDISGFSAAILKEAKVSERKEIFFATESGHKSIILKQTLPCCYKHCHI